MFIVEVDFNDGDSESEIVLLKRAYARIGSLETSHLILDGVKFEFEVLLEKSFGNTFRCSAFRDNEVDFSPSWAGLHSRSVQLCIDSVFITIISVDHSVSEFVLDNSRKSASNKEILENLVFEEEKLFPAIQSLSSPRVGISLSKVSNCFIGRSRECLFRMDHPSLHSKHAVIKRSTSSFVIETVSSDSNLSVNGRHIGREAKELDGGDRIELSPSAKLVFLKSEQDLEEIIDELSKDGVPFYSGLTTHTVRSDSSLVNPKLLPLGEGQTLSIGRDPVHSIWINAAFISRHHVSITVYKDQYGITDLSSNGTKVNSSKLDFNRETFFPNTQPLKISLGPNAELYLSNLNEAQHKAWLEGGGDSEVSTSYEELSGFNEIAKENIIENLERKVQNSRYFASQNLVEETDSLNDAEPQIESELESDVEVSEDFDQSPELPVEEIPEPEIKPDIESQDTPIQEVEKSNTKSNSTGEEAGDIALIFEQFQKNQVKKLRNADELNYIDYNLEESMENYSYEAYTPPTTHTKSFTITASIVILLIFASILVLLSQFVL